MLTAKQNELLCRVGPGTPMGNLLREYWWPVLIGRGLEKGAAPVRVRLMGEDFVAFRSPDGTVGVVDERCPHRGVSLMLARNEDCGLRCILHGWKVSADGKVLETPNEKEAGTRLSKLKVRALPVQEAGGMIWVYAGGGEPPAFPAFDFNTAHACSPIVGKIGCNWFQTIETLWDPAHVQILHAQGDNFRQQYEGLEAGLAASTESFWTAGLETRDEPFGFSYRFTEGIANGAGLTDWVPTAMPCWVFISTVSQNPYGDRVALGHTPIDDENVLVWQLGYNIEGELGPLAQQSRDGVIDENNFAIAGMTRANNWLQDREAMKAGDFTGIGMGMGTAGILLQDAAALESMGKISDRTKEQVGPADGAVVKGRHVFLAALRAHMEGKPALGIDADMSLVGAEIDMIARLQAAE